MFGTGVNAERITKDIFGNAYHDIIRDYSKKLTSYRNQWGINKRNYEREKGVTNGAFTVTELHYKTSKPIMNLSVRYSPFSGHLIRLSHYFRHLYHIVKYVDEQDENIISIDKKKRYIKTLRAQLSVHEQLLLYYNYLTVLGGAWSDKNNGESFLEKYKLIKNIPIPLAEMGEDIRSIYNMEDYFEWDEISQRLNKKFKN